MKITYNDAVNQKIADLIDRDAINMDLGTAITIPVSEGIVFDDYETLRKNALELRARLKLLNTVYSHDESTVAAMMFNIMTVNNSFDLVPEVLLHNIVRSSRIFHEESETDTDLFVQKFTADEIKNGDFSVKAHQYNKYELFFYDNAEIRDPGITVPKIGAADHGFKVPSVYINDEEMMSFATEMISGMKPFAEKAKGKVLVLGCGMGYFAYLVSLKDEVESVTIIERDPQVVKMFNELILPKFENSSKITVKEEDALAFMENCEDGAFDYCLADIWGSLVNVLPYMLLKKICSKFSKTQIDYYAEENLKYSAEFYVHQIIIQDYQRNNDLPVPPVSEFMKDEQEKIKFFTDLLSDEEISTAEDIEKLLTADNVIDKFINNSELRLEK